MKTLLHWAEHEVMSGLGRLAHVKVLVQGGGVLFYRLQRISY